MARVRCKSARKTRLICLDLASQDVSPVLNEAPPPRGANISSGVRTHTCININVQRDKARAHTQTRSDCPARPSHGPRESCFPLLGKLPTSQTSH